MRTVCFVFILGLAPLLGHAQSRASFTGRVIDAKSNQPIADATVTIPGLPGTSRTDRDGRFIWEGSPSVPFQVIVVLPGGQVARPVDVTALDEAVVTIPVNALTDEAVTVVGAARDSCRGEDGVYVEP